MFSKFSVTACLRRLHPPPHTRSITAFIRDAFNDVDRERLRVVGADRLCAEWWLKNEGQVKLHDRSPQRGCDGCPANRSPSCSFALKSPKITTFYTDYLDLPDEQEEVRVRELEATGASMTGAGFEHLQGCQCIERLRLTDCCYVDDVACDWLGVLRHSLLELHICNCTNITADGLAKLDELRQLQRLHLSELPQVRDWPKMRKYLADCLPVQCEVIMPCEGKCCDKNRDK